VALAWTLCVSVGYTLVGRLSDIFGRRWFFVRLRPPQQKQDSLTLISSADWQLSPGHYRLHRRRHRCERKRTHRRKCTNWARRSRPTVLQLYNSRARADARPLLRHQHHLSLHRPLFHIWTGDLTALHRAHKSVRKLRTSIHGEKRLVADRCYLRAL
jgi:hypothetical protein